MTGWSWERATSVCVLVELLLVVCVIHWRSDFWSVPLCVDWLLSAFLVSWRLHRSVVGLLLAAASESTIFCKSQQLSAQFQTWQPQLTIAVWGKLTTPQLVLERLKASQVQEVEGLRGRVDERQRVKNYFSKSLKSEREFPRTTGESL